jgi:phosphohistidine phosphatase
MDLLLWRHAQAELGEPDDDRALTARGRKQALRMAHWLERNLPTSCRILVSPARRTVQTAEALGRPFKIVPALAPEALPRDILAAVNWPAARDPVLIVGHQPALGQIAALLLTGVAADWTVRKANLWWIAQRKDDEGASHYLKAVLAPELVMT